MAARGNRIILTPDRGFWVEGIVNAGETFYPGMGVQMDPSQALQGGRHVHKIYNADADGGRPKGPIIIVTEDIKQGKNTGDSYAAGERFQGFIPLPGCELNLLLENIAGTADDHAAGEILMLNDGTGKWIAATGSPETEPAMHLDTVTDPTADTLSWCVWTGY